MLKNCSKISTDIPVRCYQLYAYPLHSIFLCDGAYDWYFSNYINYKLFTYEDAAIKSNNIDLKYIAPRYNEFPSFVIKSMHRDIFAKYLLQDIRDFICYYIDQGCTISFFVDEFYIPNRARYNKEHKTHQLLVIGYDFQNDQVKIIGYDASYSYCTSYISTVSLINGFSCCPYIRMLSENVTIYQVKDIQKTYDIDINIFKSDLFEFYHSINSYSPEVAVDYGVNKIDFGLQCYKTLGDFFANPNYYTKNHPMFYMICEHKANMVKKLQYLQKKTGVNMGNLIIEYQSIHSLAKRILQFFLKRVHNSPGETSFNKASRRIVDLLDEIYEKEYNTVSKILEKI